MLGWLFDLLGYKNVRDGAGVAYPQRDTVRFPTATIRDNPTLGCTDVLTRILPPDLQSYLTAHQARIELSSGTYGAATVPAGDAPNIIGDQFTTTIGALSMSGGSFVALQGVDCDGNLQYTDNNAAAYLALIQCEVGITGAITLKGSTAGGLGILQLIDCDFGFACPINNWQALFTDDYSERQLFGGGSPVTSSVAGPIALVSIGSQSNAKILVNADATLNFGLRYIVQQSVMTADRNYALNVAGMGLNQIIQVDSYNHSGHNAVFKNGVTTVYTAPSSTIAQRIRFKCTVAGTTVLADSIEQLNGPTA